MTSARPLSDPANPPGATPVGGGNRGGGRKKGLLLGTALLAVLLLAALLLSQCGTDDPQTSSNGAAQTSEDAGSSDPSPAERGSAASSAPGGSATGGGAGSGQIVTADGESVLDLAGQPEPAAALGALAGQLVTGTGARVLTVPADEGFWVGTSDQQRVWVQLTGEGGESPYQVTEGDTVDFEGTVVAHDQAFADEVGVDEAEGAGQLSTQATHLEVAKSAVKLSS